jgi:hypothetical protein
MSVSSVVPPLAPPLQPDLSGVVPSLPFMYETFDPLHSMEWTINSMVFTQEL